jgi:transcriptional regulator with XRE-family HTH domain
VVKRQTETRQSVRRVASAFLLNSACVSRHKQRKLTPMAEQNLGELLRDLRGRADLSLRELARSVDVSAPFLSDVELGRRYPSDEVLTRLAKALKVPLEQLKQHDHREAVADMKKLIDGNPALGFAFRSAVENVKGGKITAAQLAAALKRTNR